MSSSSACPWCQKTICRGESTDPRSCLYFGTPKFSDGTGTLSDFGLTMQEAKGGKVPTWLSYHVGPQAATE